MPPPKMKTWIKFSPGQYKVKVSLRISAGSPRERSTAAARGKSCRPHLRKLWVLSFPTLPLALHFVSLLICSYCLLYPRGTSQLRWQAHLSSSCAPARDTDPLGYLLPRRSDQVCWKKWPGQVLQLKWSHLLARKSDCPTFLFPFSPCHDFQFAIAKFYYCVMFESCHGPEEKSTM